MFNFQSLEKEIKEKMQKTISHLQSEFGSLRTGRASASLLDKVRVNVYGSEMPLSQVGTISVPEAQMLSVSIWDRSIAGPAEKAIRESGLGLNPSSDGTLIRIPIPPLNEERRVELVKVAKEFAENAKISVRNARRDGIEALRKAENSKEISKDDLTDFSEEIQTITDKFTKEVEEHLKNKEAEIMKV